MFMAEGVEKGKKRFDERQGGEGMEREKRQEKH
jgi:hypothetical protein